MKGHGGWGAGAELPQEATGPGIPGNSQVLVHFGQSELFLLKAEIGEAFFLPFAIVLPGKVAGKVTDLDFKIKSWKSYHRLHFPAHILLVYEIQKSGHHK